MKGKKILEICNFSAGVSGVWTRVFEESKRLAKNNDVYVFSSDIENDSIAKKSEEVIENVHIKRFSVKKRAGYALFFNFISDALRIKPDIIIVHGYRKPYLDEAIRVARIVGAKIYLVTHAPFVEKGIRSWKLAFIVKLYDRLYGKKILNSFDKIIAITKWEIPFLLSLGAKKEKIKIIPNGVPEEFFKVKKNSENKKKVLFFGRVDKIKNIESLIIAMSKVHSDYELDITGPGDYHYISKLKSLATELNVNVKFNLPFYKTPEKIKKIDSCSIFVLPSKREAMPIALIEAMSRGKIVISSDTFGGKEIIENGKNGFIFQRGNSDELAKIITLCLDESNSKGMSFIKKNAINTAKKYKWSEIIQRIYAVLGI